MGGVAHSTFCRWMHNHVILVGEFNHVQLKENILAHSLKVEIHDRDENIDARTSSEENVLKNQHGVALFNLKDLITTNSKSIRLRSDLLPVKRTMADDHKNLDLNT